jgi:hypothetical protein
MRNKTELENTLFNLGFSRFDEFNKDGKYPMHIAAERDDRTALEILLKHGADVNQRPNIDSNDLSFDMTPLLSAICNQHIESAMLLLQYKADIRILSSEAFKTFNSLTQDERNDNLSDEIRILRVIAFAIKDNTINVESCKISKYHKAFTDIAVLGLKGQLIANNFILKEAYNNIIKAVIELNPSIDIAQFIIDVNKGNGRGIIDIFAYYLKDEFIKADVKDKHIAVILCELKEDLTNNGYYDIFGSLSNYLDFIFSIKLLDNGFIAKIGEENILNFKQQCLPNKFSLATLATKKFLSEFADEEYDEIIDRFPQCRTVLLEALKNIEQNNSVFSVSVTKRKEILKEKIIALESSPKEPIAGINTNVEAFKDAQLIKDLHITEEDTETALMGTN